MTRTNWTRTMLPMLCLLLCASGCAGWSDAKGWDYPVWSDDAKHVAAVAETYETKPNPWSMGGVSYRRNFTTALYVGTVKTPSKPACLALHAASARARFSNRCPRPSAS